MFVFSDETADATPYYIYACLIIYLNSSFASFAPHALKGQKLLAQGIALGYYGRNPVAL